MTENRTCEHSHCDRALKPRQKRFCSYECKNRALTPGKRGGRCSLYKKRYADNDVWEYLLQCELNTAGKQPLLPSIEGYLNFLWRKYGITIHKNTVSNWAKRHPQFEYGIELIKSMQHEHLINTSLSGRCNATFAVFLLKANHGYGTKQHENKSQKMSIVREVYKLADKLDQTSTSTTPFTCYSADPTRTQALIT